MRYNSEKEAQQDHIKNYYFSVVNTNNAAFCLHSFENVQDEA